MTAKDVEGDSLMHLSFSVDFYMDSHVTYTVDVSAVSTVVFLQAQVNCLSWYGVKYPDKAPFIENRVPMYKVPQNAQQAFKDELQEWIKAIYGLQFMME